MLKHRNVNAKVSMGQASHKASKSTTQPTSSSKPDQNSSRIRTVDVTVKSESGSSYVIEAVSLAGLLT